jgi:hypothetical protein
MPIELIILIVMLFIFFTKVSWLKLPSGLALSIAAITGALATIRIKIISSLIGITIIK